MPNKIPHLYLPLPPQPHLADEVQAVTRVDYVGFLICRSLYSKHPHIRD